jgi:hypothetical protein
MAEAWGENEPATRAGRGDNVIDLRSAAAGNGPPVTFSRRELDLILRLYGNKVANGEWRDYAIDMLRDRAVFSVFRRASEVPLFRIEKDPRLSRRQGAYSITNASGHVLKRGRELDKVLRLFEPAPRLALI